MLRRVLRSKIVIALGVIVALLIAARAVLPIVVKRYVNRTLDELEGYSGQIEDVDIALLRGAYVIEGVKIVKTGGKAPTPFLAASEIDLSVEWRALLDGAIVAEIDARKPVLNFVMATEKKASADAPKPRARSRTGDSETKEEQIEPSSNWTDVVQDLVPFNINRFSIADGEVHYRDFSTTPKVDIYVQDLNAEARNLTNSEDRTGSLVAHFKGSGTAMGSGRIRFDGRVDPYAKQPTFEADFRLNGLQLRQLNPYLRAYANVDVEKGTFAMDAEFAARNGEFSGYVKPFIKDLDVLRWKQENESFPNKLWQGLVDVVTELLEDQKRDQAAARIPFSGRFDQPNVDVWAALGSLLKNAFIEALRRGLEGSIDIERVVGKDSD